MGSWQEQNNDTIRMQWCEYLRSSGGSAAVIITSLYGKLRYVDIADTENRLLSAVLPSTPTKVCNTWFFHSALSFVMTHL